MIKEDEVFDAYLNQTAKVIGGVSPCREMKYTGWVVISLNEQLWAIAIDVVGDPLFAELIKEENLHLYTE